MSRIRCLGTAVLAVTLVLPVASTEAGFVAVGTTHSGSRSAVPTGSGTPSTIDVLASTIDLAANANDSSRTRMPTSEGYLLSLMDEFTLALAPAPVAPGSASGVNVNFSPVGIMLATAAVGVVPEPGSIVLFGLGALGVFAAARRRRKTIN